MRASFAAALQETDLLVDYTLRVVSLNEVEGAAALQETSLLAAGTPMLSFQSLTLNLQPAISGTVRST